MSEIELIPHETKFPHFGNGVFDQLPVGTIFACSTEDHLTAYMYDPNMDLPDTRRWVVKAKNVSWVFINHSYSTDRP